VNNNLHELVNRGWRQTFTATSRFI